MKIAIIGSRSFTDYNLMKKRLDNYFQSKNITPTLIVSGGASGADSLGEQYAEEKNIPTQIFLPDWKKYGKKAGFIRNTAIINDSELIICFWDGESRGSKDSMDKAINQNKELVVFNIKNY